MQGIIISIILLAFISACGAKTPVATQYKQQRQAETESGGGDATVAETPETEEAESLAEESEEEAAAEEEEAEPEEAGPTPEEIAAQEAAALKLQGKQIYEGMCMGCHGAPAATTLNSRDANQIAQQNTFQPHSGIAATFPDAAMAAGIISFLTEPN